MTVGMIIIMRLMDVGLKRWKSERRSRIHRLMTRREGRHEVSAAIKQRNRFGIDHDLCCLDLWIFGHHDGVMRELEKRD